MKTLLTFILSLFTLSASAATTNYLAAAPRTNDNFFLSDTNVVMVGNGIWTWTTTLGYFRSNIMRLGGVTGPLNVNGLTNLAQIIQTTELDVQNILPKTTALSIYAGSSSGILYDFANRIAVDFKNHKLYDAAQNVIVDFSDTNNVTLSAPITALKFTGDGSGLSNVTAIAVSGTGATIGSFKDSAAFQFGYIDGGTNGGLVLTNASGSYLRFNTNGNITASGTITANLFSGSGASLTSIPEAAFSLTDVTTANASTSAHGFLKKLDNTATHYMDGTGAWSTPATPAAAFISNLIATNSNGNSNLTVTAQNGSIQDFWLTNHFTITNWVGFNGNSGCMLLLFHCGNSMTYTNLISIGKQYGVNVITNDYVPLWQNYTNLNTYAVLIPWSSTNIGPVTVRRASE